MGIDVWNYGVYLMLGLIRMGVGWVFLGRLCMLWNSSMLMNCCFLLLVKFCGLLMWWGFL